jgi:hypothetical protein
MNHEQCRIKIERYANPWTGEVIWRGTIYAGAPAVWMSESSEGAWEVEKKARAFIAHMAPQGWKLVSTETHSR